MNSPALRPVFWTDEDALALREFFDSKVGSRVFEAIRLEPSSHPPAAGSAERQLGIIQGYRMAIAMLVQLTQPTPKDEQKSAYEPLPPE